MSFVSGISDMEAGIMMMPGGIKAYGTSVHRLSLCTACCTTAPHHVQNEQEKVCSTSVVSLVIMKLLLEWDSHVCAKSAVKFNVAAVSTGS